jgi:DNA polymerase III epsilon subunit-like protein
MILFDTETTGLPQPLSVPLDRQPRIIEFSALKLDDKSLKEKDRINIMINPGVPISAEITRITGIKQEDLEDKKSFGVHFRSLVDFFLGETILVAHNLDFDGKLLQFDLQRIGREFTFPWPFRRICTVEASYPIKNYRLNLGALYEIATGKKLQGAHRAINDTLALAECVRYLTKKGFIKL